MKISHAVMLALALPIGLAAQQAPAGQAANPITTVFQTRTLNFQRNLAQAFDSIPESKFGYKPTPAQLTIGYIAQHLASDNYFFCNNFGAMKATVPEKDTATPDSVKATWPKDTLVAKLKASFTFCESALGQLDDAKLARRDHDDVRRQLAQSAAREHGARPRDRHGGPLQPARELHAAERHVAAHRAAAATHVEMSWRCRSPRSPVARDDGSRSALKLQSLTRRASRDLTAHDSAISTSSGK